MKTPLAPYLRDATDGRLELVTPDGKVYEMPPTVLLQWCEQIAKNTRQVILDYGSIILPR